MATLTRFEDLEAWKKARELAREVYEATRQPRFARDFALCDQIRRAVISVMSNIAEGFERAGPRTENPTRNAKLETRNFLPVGRRRMFVQELLGELADPATDVHG
ncbi:MAG: four helix bundle protein [Vicinamibacterales bacterium]